MDPRHLFMDDRLRGMCAYCEAIPDTRDHVPSKVLLDDPLPPQLPVVNACAHCNEGYSLDEQYLACFLECVLSGTTDPSLLQRRKISRILGENPSLRKRINTTQSKDLWGNLLWEPETDRVRRIVKKLALGHVAHELHPNHEDPSTISFAPLPVLSDRQREMFEGETIRTQGIFSEIGTRAFNRTLILETRGLAPTLASERWIVVQDGRYRYSVEPHGLMVRMVLSEYLACQVAWDD